MMQTMGKRKKVPMKAQSKNDRVGAIVCLLGVALVVVGFFLPLYTEQDGSGAAIRYVGSLWNSRLFALPSLFVLVVFVMSAAALVFGVRWPGLIYQRRVAAIAGLIMQALVDALALMGAAFCIGAGCAITQAGAGLYVASLGFVVMVVGAFIARERRRS